MDDPRIMARSISFKYQSLLIHGGKNTVHKLRDKVKKSFFEQLRKGIIKIEMLDQIGDSIINSKEISCIKISTDDTITKILNDHINSIYRDNLNERIETMNNLGSLLVYKFESVITNPLIMNLIIKQFNMLSQRTSQTVLVLLNRILHVHH